MSSETVAPVAVLFALSSEEVRAFAADVLEKSGAPGDPAALTIKTWYLYRAAFLCKTSKRATSWTLALKPPIS